MTFDALMGMALKCCTDNRGCLSLDKLFPPGASVQVSATAPKLSASASLSAKIDPCMIAALASEMAAQSLPPADPATMGELVQKILGVNLPAGITVPSVIDDIKKAGSVPIVNNLEEQAAAIAGGKNVVVLQTGQIPVPPNGVQIPDGFIPVPIPAGHIAVQLAANEFPVDGGVRTGPPIAVTHDANGNPTSITY